MDEGNVFFHGSVVKNKPGTEIVQCIDDQIRVANYFFRTIILDHRGNRLHSDFLVDGCYFFFEGYALLFPYIFRPMQKLAVEIARIDTIEIDQPEKADTGARKIGRYDRSQTAAAGNHDTSTSQRFLTLDSP